MENRHQHVNFPQQSSWDTTEEPPIIKEFFHTFSTASVKFQLGIKAPPFDRVLQIQILHREVGFSRQEKQMTDFAHVPPDCFVNVFFFSNFSPFAFSPSAHFVKLLLYMQLKGSNICFQLNNSTTTKFTFSIRSHHNFIQSWSFANSLK